MIADFTYYKTVFLGKEIAKKSFDRLERQAESYLHYITQGRVTETAEEKAIKDCVCALAEYYQTLEELDKQKVISSETVGSYSVSYDTSAQSVNSGMTKGGPERQKRLYAIAKQYLAWTGLLCRSVM